MAEESDAKAQSGSRAIGMAGGGGFGVFLTQLAPMFADETYRNIYLAAIPFFSVLLAEVFTFITKLVSLDANRIRLICRLKVLKLKLYFGKDNLKISSELRAIAQQRYDIIKGIEMGIYSIDDYFNTQPKIPACSVPPELPSDEQ